MDHRNCINSVLIKYNDFPSIQKDIKKVIKYLESYFRMFAVSIIDQEKIEMSTAEKAEAEIDAITDKYLPDSIEAGALGKLHSALVRYVVDRGNIPAIRAEIDNLLADHAENMDLHSDLKATIRFFGEGFLSELN